MWARAPRAPRSLCDWGPRENRGTGTTPLPSIQLCSLAPETGRTGGIGPSELGSSRSDCVDGRGTAGDEDLRSRGRLVRMGPERSGYSAIDAVSLEDQGQRLATAKKWQPQLAGAHVRLNVHMLGILNHAMREHRPNRDSTTPNSLLRAIKLLYFMPALLHSPDGRIKRRQKFELVESGDIALLLPSLMAYTR